MILVSQEFPIFFNLTSSAPSLERSDAFNSQEGNLPLTTVNKQADSEEGFGANYQLAAKRGEQRKLLFFWRVGGVQMESQVWAGRCTLTVAPNGNNEACFAGLMKPGVTSAGRR